MKHFDKDRFEEILQVLSQNKLRTFLTACGVFWGVFMLISMLGFGNGIQKGVNDSMGGIATNAMWVWGEATTKPYNGFQPGRDINFYSEDVEAIRTTIEGVQYVCPRDQLGGWRGGSSVRHNGRTGSFNVYGDVPEMRFVQPQTLVAGRNLNQMDIDEKRKVAVIGQGVEEELFEEGESAIGKLIAIQESYFMVVGVTKPKQGGGDAERYLRSISLPLTAFQLAFKQGSRIGWLAVTARPEFSSAVIEERVRNMLKTRHNVAPDDDSGVGSWNSEEEFRKIESLFSAIQILSWFVGSMTLLAGVLGVSNIMLIAVKERTKEIGIRRALGAKPSSIVAMIVQENVALTSLAGVSGLIAGFGALSLSSPLFNDPTSIMSAPFVELNVAVWATVILIILGMIAAIMPARAALKINPIEALRME